MASQTQLLQAEVRLAAHGGDELTGRLSGAQRRQGAHALGRHARLVNHGGIRRRFRRGPGGTGRRRARGRCAHLWRLGAGYARRRGCGLLQPWGCEGVYRARRCWGRGRRAAARFVAESAVWHGENLAVFALQVLGDARAVIGVSEDQSEGLLAPITLPEASIILAQIVFGRLFAYSQLQRRIRAGAARSRARKTRVEQRDIDEVFDQRLDIAREGFVPATRPQPAGSPVIKPASILVIDRGDNPRENIEFAVPCMT